MGQDLGSFEEIKNIIVSDSKEKINNSYEFYILGEIGMNFNNYSRLDVSIGNFRCNQFIIKKIENVSFTSIIVKIKDIKLKMIDSKNYLEIKNYTITQKKKIVDTGKLQLFEYKLPEILDSIDNIGAMKIISKKIKVKEIDLMTSYEYEFCDNYYSNIQIKLTDELKNQLENDKIYLFNGFEYTQNALKPLNMSSIEAIDEDNVIEQIKFPKNIDDIKNCDVVNLRGVIKGIYLSKCSVLIEDINLKTNFKIKLNFNLIKKIYQNSICTFTNFKKQSNIFIYTNLSDIYSIEETKVEINFLDFEQQYYNYLKIDNNSFKINQKKMIFDLDSTYKDEIFEQKFIYEKADEEKVINSYEFILEINKGEKNTFCSFLKESGKHTYQVYFQSKDQIYLPKSLKVKTNENDCIQIDIFDTYDNNLRKRITIINAIEQDFLEKQKTNLNENKSINNKNLKFYFLIKNKEINDNFNIENEDEINNNLEKSEIILNENENENEFSNYVFKYYENIPVKKKFLIDPKKEFEMNKIFNNIFTKEKKFEKNEGLLINLSSLLSDGVLIEYCKEGFKKYNFRNSKYDYDIIKKIVLLYSLYKYYDSALAIDFCTNLIKSNLLKIKDATYLEKIQVLLYLYTFLNKDNNNFDIRCIDIFDKKNNDIFDPYVDPCIESFNQFCDIIDKQKENCPFYQAILQFNGLIKTDLIRDIKMYSGAISSLLDIKFEIIKKINRFFFVYNCTGQSSDGEFYPNSKIIVFYPKSFVSLEKDSKKKNIIKKTATAFLFLIFHEFCGHFKTHINNNQNSPMHYINNDLNLMLLNFANIDSGFLFEHILTNNFIDLKMIIQAENSEELFDSKYYIQDNFNELRKKIGQISSNILYFPKVNLNNEKKKYPKISEEKKNELKGLPEDLIIKLEEVSKNLDEYNYNRLYPLFKIPENMTFKEFDEILKDNIVYRKFKQIISKGAKY